MSKILQMITAGSVLALSVLPVQAADVTLTISSWAPPTHGINSVFWPKFIEKIEEATEGRVTAEIKYGLASPPAQFDVVLDGVADITWIVNGYTPSRFPSSTLFELPGYEGSAEDISEAYWHTYEKFMASAGEYDGVKLIALSTNGPGLIHSRDKVSSISDVEGLKLRIGGEVASKVGKALGATGIRVPAPKVYETVASNSADGVMMQMDAKNSFKLFEIAKNTYAVPGGFYRSSFAMIMNEDSFAGLTDADQKALDKVFGAALSKFAGEVWDWTDEQGLEKLATNDDNIHTVANDTDTVAWQKIAEPIIKEVVTEVSEAGFDAPGARAFLMDRISK